MIQIYTEQAAAEIKSNQRKERWATDERAVGVRHAIEDHQDKLKLAGQNADWESYDECSE